MSENYPPELSELIFKAGETQFNIEVLKALLNDINKRIHEVQGKLAEKAAQPAEATADAQAQG